jgi:hypothetical protein
MLDVLVFIDIFIKFLIIGLIVFGVMYAVGYEKCVAITLDALDCDLDNLEDLETAEDIHKNGCTIAGTINAARVKI